MEYQFDDDWTLEPIGGDTGEAYMGIRKEEKVFLKRNTSPFLAALSMEGITPKLIWTKRASTGDVITAQEWLTGHELSAIEMQQGSVIKLIHRYHHSDNLYNMLVKIGGKCYEPADLLAIYTEGLHPHLQSHSFLGMVLQYLQQVIGGVENARKTVCHGDLNRRNLILSDDNRLYLVDWEMVKIADPIYDITQLLVQYIDYADWEHWFELYGLKVTEDVYYRIEWYAMFNLLSLIKKDFSDQRNYALNEKILKLRHIYDNRFYQEIS